MLTHPPWTSVAGLRHSFLDAAECAADDWRAVLEAANTPLPITLSRQVHGARVVSASDDDPGEADGLVTARPGLLVGVVTADCVPVLLLDRRRRAVAAVHAGWRGGAAGVLEAAVGELKRSFGSEPRDLEAAIGPAIGACCYEVGPEVLAAFRARAGSVTDAAWSTRDGRRYVDLRAAARLLLGATGVPVIEMLGPCTACGTGYHSYRRDRERTGRQLSFVGWS